MWPLKTGPCLGQFVVWHRVKAHRHLGVYRGCKIIGKGGHGDNINHLLVEV